MKTWIVGILIFILTAIAVTIIVLITLPPSSSSPVIPTDDTCTEKSKLGFVNRSLNFVVGNTSALVIDVQPTNGTLNTNTENTITYVPAVDFTGSDTFTYTLNSSSRCVIQNITICDDQLVQQGSKFAGTGASESAPMQGNKVLVSYNGLILASSSTVDNSGEDQFGYSVVHQFQILSSNKVKNFQETIQIVLDKDQLWLLPQMD